MNFKENDFEKLIKNYNVPLVFNGFMNSPLEGWTLSDWNNLFGTQQLEFRCGKNEYSWHPQYETRTKTIKGTFQNFLNQTLKQENSKEWWYFDYKYLNMLPFMLPVEKNISWSRFGLDDDDCSDSESGVIWIGSKGAHTCCHKDTYGCNLVYQIYGRKQWLLFPPKEDLGPSRIPYEESSIFSKMNFFSPNHEEFSDMSHGWYNKHPCFDEIDNCYKVILNPGDVLLVPFQWWHYVENLETSISVNKWIELPQDKHERIKESYAQVIFSSVANSDVIGDDYKKAIITPNMIKKMLDVDDVLSVIDDIYEHETPSTDVIPQSFELILHQYVNSLSKVPKMEKEHFRQMMLNQRERFESEAMRENEFEACRCGDCGWSYRPREIEMSDFLDILTDDEVLSLIHKKMKNYL